MNARPSTSSNGRGSPIGRGSRIRSRTFPGRCNHSTPPRLGGCPDPTQYSVIHGAPGRGGLPCRNRATVPKASCSTGSTTEAQSVPCRRAGSADPLVHGERGRSAPARCRKPRHPTAESRPWPRLAAIPPERTWGVATMPWPRPTSTRTAGVRSAEHRVDLAPP